MPAKRPVISPRRGVKKSQIPTGGASVILQFVADGGWISLKLPVLDRDYHFSNYGTDVFAERTVETVVG